MYKRLANIRNTDLSELARVDMTILFGDTPNPYESDVSNHVQFVIEVKRGSASNESIDEDLRRLLYFKQACTTEARAFLIVASEAKLPQRFVEDKGSSKLDKHDIPGTTGCYHVRRTVKAAPSFIKTGSAHYVCIVEIFTKPPKKLPAF